jgi:tetratricopeptide (TPR) repeat protein
MAQTDMIRTPDQRVRVFISSALQELAAERRAARDAVTSLRLVPVMFELGARPYPPRPVYRAYLAQSQVFVGIYWQSYGWVAPGEQISGLEDEYRLSAGLPRLIYVKTPAPAGTADLPPYQQAMALTGVGFILMANGDQARARQVFEQSLPAYRQVGERLGVMLNASVLAVLGRLATAAGDYQGAGRLLDEGRALLQEVGYDGLTGYDRLQYLLTAAFVDNFLGQVRLGQHDHDGAARLFADGLAESRRAPDAIALLISLYDLALAGQAQGDPAGSEGYLKEGLALAAKTGDETSAAYYLEVLAAVAGQRDDPQRAVRLLAAARALLEARGSGWLHAYVPRVPPGDADLAGWRSRLGEAAFEEAQAWGSTAGSRRAVEYALG